MDWRVMGICWLMEGLRPSVMLRTHENVNVKDILYSAKCGVHVIIFEVPKRVVVDPPKDGKRAGLRLKPNP